MHLSVTSAHVLFQSWGSEPQHLLYPTENSEQIIGYQLLPKGAVWRDGAFSAPFIIHSAPLGKIRVHSFFNVLCVFTSLLPLAAYTTSPRMMEKHGLFRCFLHPTVNWPNATFSNCSRSGDLCFFIFFIRAIKKIKKIRGSVFFIFFIFLIRAIKKIKKIRGSVFLIFLIMAIKKIKKIRGSVFFIFFIFLIILWVEVQIWRPLFFYFFYFFYFFN